MSESRSTTSAPAFPATRRQQELLRFITGYVEVHGMAPSQAQCASALGMRHKSVVNAMLDRLEARGKIVRQRYRPHSIEVLVKPILPRAPDGAPLCFIPTDRLVLKDPQQ